MPVKLIGTLCVAVVAAFFTGYNLDHRCDVWLFHTFENVPVAVTILVSLLSGVIITLPFTFGKREHIKTEAEIEAEARQAARAEKLRIKAEKERMKAEKKAAKLAEKEVRKAKKTEASVPAVQAETGIVPVISSEDGQNNAHID